VEQPLRVDVLGDGLARRDVAGVISFQRLRPGGSIPVMSSAVSDQFAPNLLQRPYEVAPFHGTTNSSTLRTPGTTPLVRSRYRSIRCSFRSSSERGGGLAARRVAARREGSLLCFQHRQLPHPARPG